MQNIFPTALLQKFPQEGNVKKEYTKMQWEWNFGLTSNKKKGNDFPRTVLSHVKLDK